MKTSSLIFNIVLIIALAAEISCIQTPKGQLAQRVTKLFPSRQDRKRHEDLKKTLADTKYFKRVIAKHENPVQFMKECTAEEYKDCMDKILLPFPNTISSCKTQAQKICDEIQ